MVTVRIESGCGNSFFQSSEEEMIIFYCSVKVSSSAFISQGWIVYAVGTHVPMSVPRFGLIKPGQTYVCPKLCIKNTLWLILHVFEDLRLFCP